MIEDDHPYSGASDEIMADDDPSPLGSSSEINHVQVELDERFGTEGPPFTQELVKNWNRLLGGGMETVQFMTHWRGAGLRRPGMVAHLLWPRLNSRVALGIDPPLAHAVVDRLLGYERTAAESRLQISPVEWGILSFMIANGLQSLDDHPGPLGPWDLAIDHVGPDPFDVTHLGPVVTWRWWVRVGSITGSARLWIPESLVSRWLENEKDINRGFPVRSQPMSTKRSGNWKSSTKSMSECSVEAGLITLKCVEEVESLTPGQLLLIDDAPLSGTISVPNGNVLLSHTDRLSCRWFPAKLETNQEGLGIRITGTIQHRQVSATMLRSKRSDRPDSYDSILKLETSSKSLESLNRSEKPGVRPILTVELCRVNLPLECLAELRHGDLVQLSRQGGDPVDLTLDGRVIAQGELVQIDIELGVRITRTYP